jgi:hypothetical protein
MRRFLNIAFAVMLSVTLTAPLFNVSASSIAPACCRRNGAHHCMASMSAMGSMDMMAGDTSSEEGFSNASSKCPRFPVASPAPQPHSLVTSRLQTAGVPLFSRPMSQPQTEARYRIAYARSRTKRGPPVFYL